MSASLMLCGLDGGNSLALLAALGTHRVLTLLWPSRDVRLRWCLSAGSWRPEISISDSKLSESEVLETLQGYLARPIQFAIFDEIGPDLNIAPGRFAVIAREHLAAAHESSDSESARVILDFLAAFGCEATVNDSEPVTIQDTELRTMSGAGHQHFLAFMKALIESTNIQHLEEALFHTWTYSDDGQGLNMRWDPQDDRRYALRWLDPSKDPNTTCRGANRLAIEGLPTFATIPTGTRLFTTGFRSFSAGGPQWTWPIWDSPLSWNVVRSLMARTELQQLEPRRDELRRLGIVAAYRCRRITIDKFRSFTPAVAIA